MAFSTKKYTRPVLAEDIKQLSSTRFMSLGVLAQGLSPRARTKSAKFAALKKFVGGKSALVELLGTRNPRKAILAKLN